MNKPFCGLLAQLLPHDFLKQSINSPFEKILTLLQCTFPLERGGALSEGARVSICFPKPLALEQNQLALKTLAFYAFSFVQ